MLILDNCEHVIEACARLANLLLRNCPGLRILATSREPLGVAGERMYPVRSLGLPDEQARPALDELAEFEALSLFAERARAADPGFSLTPENVGAVIDICRRLDGIPLAIELAAARVRALTVEQIAERLDDRFRLLSGGSRTVMPRHQTLRAAIEWSFGLLPEAERSVLWRLSVFAGAFIIGGIVMLAVERFRPKPTVVDADRTPLMRALVLEGRIEDARTLQLRLMPLARSVGSTYGVPGLKAALELMGFAAGPPRPPLRPAVSPPAHRSFTHSPAQRIGRRQAAHPAGDAWKPIFECVPSQNGFIVEPPQRHSARLTRGTSLPSASTRMKSPSTTYGPLLRIVILTLMVGLRTAGSRSSAGSSSCT